MLSAQLQQDITKTIAWSLHEDLNDSQDITAELIPSEHCAVATVISRDECIICGVEWVNEVFRQLDALTNKNSQQSTQHGTQQHKQPATKLTWFVSDGQHVGANTTLFELSGNARTLLTGERTALNFLQTLSGTATITSQYVKQLSDTNTQLLDTRKTLPGLRSAQKYAVTCGGGVNHRIGLFDAFLIKENHIAACGGIEKAILTARNNHQDKKVEVEVESLEELKQALNAAADIIMLDNFTHQMIDDAVLLTEQISQGRTKLEVSGNMTIETLKSYAKSGIDYISVGALTKHVNAIDLSMRFS